MTLKSYSTFPKTPALLEPPHQIVLHHIQSTCSGGGSCSSVKMQSVYSTAPADWGTYFQSSSPLTKPFGIILSALITTGITVTFMFHSFFTSLVRYRYLSLLLLSFNFTLWSTRMVKSTIWLVLFFFLVDYHSVCCMVLAGIHWQPWRIAIKKHEGHKIPRGGMNRE